jgi:hypothetical protein
MEVLPRLLKQLRADSLAERGEAVPGGNWTSERLRVEGTEQPPVFA